MVKTLRGSQQGTVGGGDAERVQLVFSRRSCGYGASIAVYRRRGDRERQREPECGRGGAAGQGVRHRNQSLGVDARRDWRWCPAARRRRRKGAEPAPEHFATEGDAALSLRGAGGARAMGRRGAEFQQISGVLPLAEQKSPAQADSQMKVMVGMTSLSIVTNDKMDE